MQDGWELREAMRQREELKAKLFRAQSDVARRKAELADLEQRILKNLDASTGLICW